MTKDLGQELLKMKNHIAKSKSEADQITGQIKQIESQRAQELGCSTDEEAEEYIKELQGDVSQLEKELVEGLETVQQELGWDI
jgi:hypothetical protein